MLDLFSEQTKTLLLVKGTEDALEVVRGGRKNARMEFTRTHQYQATKASQLGKSSPPVVQVAAQGENVKVSEGSTHGIGDDPFAKDTQGLQRRGDGECHGRGVGGVEQAKMDQIGEEVEVLKGIEVGRMVDEDELSEGVGQDRQVVGSQWHCHWIECSAVGEAECLYSMTEHGQWRSTVVVRLAAVDDTE